MFNNFKFAIVAVIFFAAAASAQTAVSTLPKVASMAAVSPVAEELKQINERIVLLQAQLNELEVRAKIAARQGEIDRFSGSSATKPVVIPEQELPSVRAIDGFDRKLRATLSFRNGLTQSVVVGDRIGGWYVRQINVNSVGLSLDKSGGEIVQLGFGVAPAQSSAAAFIPPAPMAVPSGMTIPGLPR